MSLNITLTAEAVAEIKLKSGKRTTRTITEDFSVWQTPTEVTKRILALLTFEEQLAAYTNWAMATGNDEVWDWTWEEGDPTIQLTFNEEFEQIVTGDTVRPRVRTQGQIHLEELEGWLRDHQDWNLHFGYT